MMMSQDPQEQGRNLQEKRTSEAKAEAEILNKELPSEIPDQEQLLPEHSSEQSQSQSQTQSQSPMPSDDRMRHAIADSLMEMLANMTHSQYLHECLELLEATDPLQARSQILDILQRIDGQRVPPPPPSSHHN